MKKILGLIIVLLLAFGGYKIWDYYQETYVGHNYYGVISEPLPEETTIKDDNGKSFGKGYVYKVTAFDENGKSRELTFSVVTKGEYKDGSAYEAGTILKFNASDKRIIEKSVISIDDVPEKIRKNIQ